MTQPNIAYRDRKNGTAKIKIMVVDDQTVCRDGIKALLAARTDIEVVGEAENGQEAYTKVMELLPDVVLMEIVMPIEDGIVLTRRIRRDQRNAKIVILSRHSDEQTVRSAITAGASGYLPKTANIDDVVHAIVCVHHGGCYFHFGVTRPIIETYRRLVKADPLREGIDLLTPRELNILKLVAQGRTSLEISKMLAVSDKTVNGRRARMMRKLGVRNTTELTKYAMQKGILSEGE